MPGCATAWLPNVSSWFNGYSWEELLLVAATALVLLVLCFLCMPKLNSGPSSAGIMALQLAWTPARARRVVEGWRDERLVGRARFGVYLDFLLPWFYAAFAVLVVVMLARAGAAREALADTKSDDWSTVGTSAIIGAAILDLVENVGLLGLLKSERFFRLAGPVSLIAVAKFWLIGVTIVSGGVLTGALLVDYIQECVS